MHFRVELMWQGEDDTEPSSLYLAGDGRVILRGRALTAEDKRRLSLPADADLISVDRALIRAIKEML